MRIRTRATALLIVAAFTSGCSTMQGVPTSLTDAQLKDAITNVMPDLKPATDLAVGRYKEYKEARDTNLSYAFWSNALLVPIAVAAAVYTFHKTHPNSLAYLGIGAGGVAGFSTFLNARANAKVYQGGMNAMTCAIARVSAIDPSKLVELKQAHADASTRRPAVQRDLDGTLSVITSPGGATAAEVATLVQTRDALMVALSQLTGALVAADREIASAGRLSGAVFALILDVEKAIASKITQPDVDFTALRDGLGKATGGTAGASGDGTGAGAAPAAATVPLAAPGAPVPSVAATQALLTKDLAEVRQLTATLIAKSSAADLSGQLTALSECNKVA